MIREGNLFRGKKVVENGHNCFFLRVVIHMKIAMIEIFTKVKKLSA